MEERRALGFRQRPRFSEVLEYIEEGQPLTFPLPNRNASIYKSSHFYLDDFPQSTEPLAENPRPHTQLGAALEDEFESADDGYQGRPFPQMRRPSFLQPGPDTDTEDEAYRRDGFDPPRPPDPGQPSSSFSGRVGEAAAAGVTGIIAAGASGVGQAAQDFGFRNATRAANAVERVIPQIIGRPADAQRVIEQAGQRAQEIQRAAAQDIEQFAAEQAAAETAEITPLLAETGAAAGEAAGAGALEVLGGVVGAALAPEIAIPAAIGLAAGAGGALAAGAGRAEASTQTEPPRGSRIAALTGGALEGARAGASAFPAARNVGRAGGAAVGGLGAATLGLGMGAVGGAYEGARYVLGGGDAASQSSEDQAPDIRTLNNMQQGTPQQQASLRAPRAQQPMVSRMDADSDDAPMAQQQSQPRPQVRSRPIQRPFGLGGGSLPRSPPVSGSDSSSRRPQRQARTEPSFNELRREALAREPEPA